MRTDQWWLRRGPMVMVVLGVGVVGLLTHYVSSLLTDMLAIADPTLDLLCRAVIDTVLLAAGLWFGAVRPFKRSLRHTIETHDRQQEKFRTDARVSDFDSALVRAMEMSETEQDVVNVVGEALEQVMPDHHGQLLLADNSQAHMLDVVSTGPERPGCGVASPGNCVAVRLGRLMEFPDSTALDACPHLKARNQRPLSAWCSPVSVTGQTIGVIHTVGEVGQEPSTVQLRELGLISHQLGARLGLIRALAHSQLQAATDQLTGLANRRTFEDRVNKLVAADSDYLLALGDLDHFKRINDTYGHDAGDKALRAAALALKSGIRDGDLVARYGGEEFVVVLAGCALKEGRERVDRLRASVKELTSDGSAPQVTISFGVAHSSEATDLESLMRLADVALFHAKEHGRDRVMTARQMREDQAPQNVKALSEGRAVSA